MPAVDRRDLVKPVAVLAFLLLFATVSFAQEAATILGPKNVPLQDGADALRAGDAEEGIRLTRIGLSQARNSRERQAANSNLCAGYVLLGQYEVGLPYCDAALEENSHHWRARTNRAVIYIKLRRFAEADADLRAGEEIRPNATTLKAARKMYLDATDPVAPSITIDDRRDPDSDPENNQAGPGDDG